MEAADEAMPARLVQVLEKASATDTEAAPHADDAKPQASTLETSLCLRVSFVSCLVNALGTFSREMMFAIQSH